MKKIIELLKILALFLSLILILFIILILSYLFPEKKIKKHIVESIPIFEEEGSYHSAFFYDGNLRQSMTLDNFTDCLILNIALNSNKTNPVKKVILNSRYNVGDQTESLKENALENKKLNDSYIRYWFGNIVFVRLLFVFMNYQSLRYFNFIFIILLIFLNLYMISQKIGLRYSFAFLISLLFCQIQVVPLSLQFSSAFIIMLITNVIILQFYNTKKFNDNLKYLFLITGALTAYFDLLTVPLITFGIPFIIVLLLRNKYEEINFKSNLFLFLKMGLLWIFSYSFTYFMKWTIASIILRSNQIKESWNAFLYRTDIASEYNKFDAIKSNIFLYFNKYNRFIILIYLVIYFVLFIKNKYYKSINFKNIVVLIIVALLPYAWYFVLSNHSYQHHFFTYRIQIITCFSFFSILFMLEEKNTKNIN